MGMEAGGWEAIEGLVTILSISLWGCVVVLTAVCAFSPITLSILLLQPQMVTLAPTQHNLSVQELTITK